MLIKTDLHVHTSHSPCGSTSPRRIENISLKRGLNCIAITDHNTIDGALEVQSQATNIKVIIGEEVKTREGEIIGYFMQETIPPFLSAKETIQQIRRQGGLVSIPHPFDTFRSSRITREALEEIISEVDMIEVFNSRDLKQNINQSFIEKWQVKGVIPVVGSDAHQPWEVGKSYMIMEDFNTPQEFLQNIKTAQSISRKSPLWVHLVTKIVKLFK
jgi:hypothetical protein